MMPSVCLINFNARIYDPVLGRFMSADPVMQSPYDLQMLNRYSYVGNNPLSLTDPSGLCFLGCFWNSSIFKDIFAIVLAIVLPEALGEIEGTAFEGILDDASVTTLNVGIAGGVAGYITTGTATGAFFGAVQANVFLETGDFLQASPTYFFGSATATTFIAHGLVGGLFSSSSRGGFLSGFLAGGVSSLADSPALESDSIAFNTAEHSILGGAGSVLGGGKFSNGAITAAFGYLYNSCMHGPCTAKDKDEIQTRAGFCIRDNDQACLNTAEDDYEQAGGHVPHIGLEFSVFGVGSMAIGAACALACPATIAALSKARVWAQLSRLFSVDPEIPEATETMTITRTAPLETFEFEENEFQIPRLPQIKVDQGPPPPPQ